MIEMLVSLSAGGAGLVRGDLVPAAKGNALILWWGQAKRSFAGSLVAPGALLLTQHFFCSPAAAQGLLCASLLQLAADDLEARKERVASWESKKADLEAKLAAPWARGARGGGGGGGAGGAWRA